LLSLDEQDDTVDEFLERAASQGMHRIRFNKLVELGRVEQAVEVAVEHLRSSASDFLNSALTLERAGYAQQAIAMVESKVDTIEHGRLLAWLANHYEASGDQVGALKLHLRRWEKDRPSLELYQTLEKLAKSLDRWDELRPKLIAGLQANENRYVLVEVHLYEEAWDLAWQVAESESGQRWGWGQNFLEIVAQATEKQRPRRASDYYLRQVQSLADQRGRKNYAEAARYLLKVRQIYQDLGEPMAWAAILADIRERNDNLPAFQDELNKAGL
jgi:transcriptional regulator with XRE-family HTH domain